MGKTCLVKNFCEKKVSFTVFLLYLICQICIQVTVYCNYCCFLLLQFSKSYHPTTGVDYGRFSSFSVQHFESLL